MSDWILCSIRLPDRNGRYLITYDDNTVDACDYDIEQGWYWTDDGVVYNSVTDVVAWMQLPEPFPV